MSVKGQLAASRDFLMVGMRAVERSSSPNSEAGQVLRACLDLLEQLVRQSENVRSNDIDTTIAVLTRGAAEIQADQGANNAVIAALRNAIAKLQACKAELVPK
jgi:hypothetical protein